MAFYAFSDLSKQFNNSATELLEAYIASSDEELLLKNIIYTDYYQRLYNPVYNKKAPIDADTQNELLLLCGATRMLNSYKFESTHDLNEDMATAYTGYLKKEDIHERYFWFLVRMMLHCTNFALEEIFKEKIPDHSAKTEDELVTSLKKILEDITFLDYDYFPSKNQLENADSYDKLMELIKTPQID